ncbi:glycosyltransferase family 4 protein [Halostella salina]|uniref:glycosyltransferase family 4 protein n=1 Tax=Halostella salina TaxID=1547897 RepID=UPI000EF7FC16|nr:glycosyltransferase family 4 protein [Halostella salina]
MRVAVVSLETWQTRESAALRRLQFLSEALAARGHDVHVLCAKWWSEPGIRREDDGVTYHGVVVDETAGTSFLVRLPVVLRSISPDVVHAGSVPPSQVTAASVGASLSRCPLVAEWYGEAELAAGSERTRRWALTRPDAVVTPSRTVKTWAREAGADGDDVTVVPDAVDFDRIRATPPGDGGSVVYARRLDEGANLESVLLALAELRDRDWTATVIGDGPEREAYEQQARDLRIDDRVTFVGECDREARIAAYRDAHVFAQTATRCAFPTELLWALACGCVGIVEYHADSSAHELVENRERGFRTTSEQELADAIVDAGDLARLDVDDDFAEFDRDAVLETYLDRYRGLREEKGLF